MTNEGYSITVEPFKMLFKVTPVDFDSDSNNVAVDDVVVDVIV